MFSSRVDESARVADADSSVASVITPTVGRTSDQPGAAGRNADRNPPVGPAAGAEPMALGDVTLHPDEPPFKKLRTSVYERGGKVHSLRHHFLQP